MPADIAARLPIPASVDNAPIPATASDIYSKLQDVEAMLTQALGDEESVGGKAMLARELRGIWEFQVKIALAQKEFEARQVQKLPPAIADLIEDMLK